ncbi:kinase-like domain-containing protein [Amanita rubescens]|nr:kinase-like domain-containing protein [Amanita rubescens]
MTHIQQMREVAEGIAYIHSEGIMHGDLRGENIVLEDDSRCRIAYFGLTHDRDLNKSTVPFTFSPHFAAPELFGMCNNCAEPACHGCGTADHVQKGGKTMKTDVYAFGCLYYTIFYGQLPFEGKNYYQIMWLVTQKERPKQLGKRMETDTWNLLLDCWKQKPSDRPSMQEIVARLVDH